MYKFAVYYVDRMNRFKVCQAPHGLFVFIRVRSGILLYSEVRAPEKVLNYIRTESQVGGRVHMNVLE